MADDKLLPVGLGSYALAWAIGVPGYAAPAHPLTHRGLIERAIELGLTRVQFDDNLPLDTLPEHELTALLDFAAQQGIAVETGTRGIAPEHLRTCLELAQRCGAPFVRVVVDTPQQHPSPADVVAALRVMQPDYESAGIVLAIENHDRFTAAMLVDILHALDSAAFGICLDTVNSFGAMEGPEVVIEALGRYVVNLHIKDFRIQRLSHNMGFSITGTPAGAGMLNVRQVIGQLRRHGRVPGVDYTATLEQWPPFSGDVQDTIAMEAQWLARSVVYLRQMNMDDAPVTSSDGSV